MHELAVTESILSIALKHAQQAEAERITDVYLVIGQLSSIVDDSIQFYWDILTEGTIAAGATLHFRRIPTGMVCLDCSARYTPGAEDLACPNCQSVRVKVVAGEEFFLEAIDVTERPLPAGEIPLT
ncbi:MAG: hydrogenase maturation nickel metallochaperone HypA [Anaerolineae bacterium]